MKNYFVHDDDAGFETFETEHAMFKRAGELIAERLGDDGWEDEVDSIVCGKITHSTKMCDIRKREDQNLDEGNCDEEGEYWADHDYFCNYKMFPVQEEVKALVKTYANNGDLFQAIQFTKDSRLECLKFIGCSASLENKGDVYTLTMYNKTNCPVVKEGDFILKEKGGEDYFPVIEENFLTANKEVKS